MPGSSKWSPSLRFSHQNPVYTSPFPHMRYMPRPVILSELITQTKLGEEYRLLSSSLCRFLHSPLYLVSLRPKYSPQQPYSQIHSACVPPSV